MPPFYDSLGGINRVITMCDFLVDQSYDVYTLSQDTGIIRVNNKSIFNKRVTRAYIYSRCVVAVQRRFVNRSYVRQLLYLFRNYKFKLLILKAFWKIISLPYTDNLRYLVNKYYREAIELISRQSIQNVIISGPPHSLHLVGYKLKTVWLET